MELKKDQYVAIHFDKLNLGSHIKENSGEDTRLTDSDQNRNLEKFFAGDDGTHEVDLARERNEEWDQFSVNEKKFNVVASFDASKYTTVLDMASLSRRQIEEAAAIAESIEKAPSSNFHVRDDRGQVRDAVAVNSDEDDEEKQYSAVVGTGKYQDAGNRGRHNGSSKAKTGDEKKRHDKPKDGRKPRPKEAHKDLLDEDYIPYFTNSKKPVNLEMKKSIQADLGISPDNATAAESEEDKANGAKHTQHVKLADKVLTDAEHKDPVLLFSSHISW